MRKQLGVILFLLSGACAAGQAHAPADATPPQMHELGVAIERSRTMDAEASVRLLDGTRKDLRDRPCEERALIGAQPIEALVAMVSAGTDDQVRAAAHVLALLGRSATSALPALEQRRVLLDAARTGVRYPPDTGDGEQLFEVGPSAGPLASVLSAIGAIRLATDCDDAATPVTTDVNEAVRAAHGKIVASKDTDTRALEMRALVTMLSGLRADEAARISEASVDRLIAMLAIDGDVGAFYGARALSAVACEAQHVLPRLRQALETLEPVRSDFGALVISPAVSPAEEVQVAIRKIEQCRSDGIRDTTPATTS